MTLYELHQFIQRVFYLNFDDSVWIEAEIAESRTHNGHIYMTLVEKDPSGQLIAKASCSLWRNKAAQLKKSLGSLYSQVVKTGNKVKLQCSVEFHPRYGYSLHAEDFDPAYTEGFLFLEKRKTIEKLKEEKLFDLNRSLELPLVTKRIAVISSPTAAGYQDFEDQLIRNIYGFHFVYELFPSAMQGDKVQSQFTSALATIEKRSNDFDIIVVVRGGGASVDLSDFDDYKVAAAVARSSLPVLAGIGHERDISVTDMVAYRRVKTPTAAAEMLIENNLKYENYIKDLYLSIREGIRQKVNTVYQNLIYTDQVLKHTIKFRMEEEKSSLNKHAYQINGPAAKKIHKEHLSLQQLRMWVVENNPLKIMERGYAMVYQNGQRIKDLDQIDKEQTIDLFMNNKNITINEK